MRITQRTLSQNSLSGLNRNLGELNKLQNQLTSGKSLNQPSDSPTGTNSSLQIRSALAANTQYAANMNDGKTWLSTAQTTLSSMVSQAQRVRDLTVQGLNTGGMSATDQQAVQAEVDQLHASLLGLANTQLQGRPVFGGATGGSEAYAVSTDPATGKPVSTYVGVDSANGVTRRITDSATVRVDVTGKEAFAAGSTGDLFSVVGDISTALTANPADLSTQLARLDDAIGSMTNALAGLGARSNRIDNALQVNSDQSLALTNQQMTVEDVDMPKTIMALSLQQTGYQAALSVASKSLQTTLVDFLR